MRYLIKAVIWGLSGLPLPALHGIGGAVGWLMSYMPLRFNRVIAANLSYVFTDRSPAERHRLHRETAIELGKTLFELAYFWGVREMDLWTKVRVENETFFKKKSEQGAILVTPHLGAWELAGLYASRHYSLLILQRPNRFGLSDLLARYRSRFGGQVVNANAHGIRRLCEALKNRQIVGLLPDQVPPMGQGISANFMGKNAYTNPLAVRLAQRFRVPIFMLTATRNRGGYRLHFREIELPHGVALPLAVQALNDAMSSRVTELPSQYLWSYKRFKQTDGASIYDF